MPPSFQDGVQDKSSLLGPPPPLKNKFSFIYSFIGSLLKPALDQSQDQVLKVQQRTSHMCSALLELISLMGNIE